MDDSFSVRVDRVFGSLSSSSKPLTSSLWSLTDEEIEKKEWRRDTETPDDADVNEASLPTDVDGFFANRHLVADEKQPRGFALKELEDDLQSLDDKEKDSGAVEKRSRHPDVAGAEVENDEWEIRNSIGMDCTLDYEEEEDKYDRVAVGDEKCGDRVYMREVYMREVNDYGIHVNSFDELPTSFREASKDPRANHLAAKLRLKEDEEALKGLSSELEMSTQDDRSSSFNKRNPLKSDEMSICGQQDQNNTFEVGTQVKSILKRKERTGSTSGKRVRFVSGCKEDDKEGVTMLSISNGEASLSLQPEIPTVPDYLRNPTKYTCYTFDETNDLDEKSNQQGYMDFINAVRKSKQLEAAEPSADLSQRVIFNPKRKAKDDSMENSGTKIELDKGFIDQDLTRKKSLAASIVSEEAEESDVCAMEEDPPQMESNRNNYRNKTSRQYRSKTIEELDDESAL